MKRPTAFATPPLVAEGTMDGGLVGTMKGTFIGPYEISNNNLQASLGTSIDSVCIDGTEKCGTLLLKLDAKDWEILNGTGDLANLHGQGTYTFFEDGTGVYEGKIHFDPQ